MRAGYHACDNCGATDCDNFAETRRLDTMWTDNETGETLCTRCKEVPVEKNPCAPAGDVVR
jgi:hypothetical protein